MTDKAKTVGQAVPLTQARLWRICNAILGWPALPPSPEEKQALVSGVGRSLGISNFVETGTYLGDMAAAQAKHFEKIVTIELANQLYQDASARFWNESTIKVVQGDSGKVLSGILDDMKGPIVYWLDAHYSKGITAGGENDAPILRELSIITSRKERGDAILIDDARLFGWRSGYPSISKIREFISRNAPHHELTVISDVIHILPRAKT